jgi:HSP20 family molecular chaperone IbpA
MKSKKSLLDRLTSIINVSKEETEVEFNTPSVSLSEALNNQNLIVEEEETQEGQLAVDVYDNGDEIIVKSMLAGVRPEDIDLTITRDMIVLRGTRADSHFVDENNYFHKELYWGTFSRTVILPVEVDPEEAQAMECNGLLLIRLQKIDKSKQTKLRVKTT